MTAMPPAAVGLVLGSAIIHTGWNFVLKQAEDKLAFSTCLLGTATLAGTPAAIWCLVHSGPPAPLALGLACCTGLLWLFYYEWTARSYERGDLSVAYPTIRGTAPVAGVALGLMMGERPSLVGLLGVALVVAGVWWIAQPADGGPRRNASTRDAVLVGIVSATYSAIDKKGVQFCPPMLYIWLCMLIAFVLLVGRTWYVRGRGAIRAVWRTATWRPAVGGVGDYCSYSLVLLALQQAPVMYVVPLRATAVLYSVLAGALVLGEPALKRRLLAGGVMVVGIALISIAK